MVLRISDRNKKIIKIRYNNNGMILTKGKRELHLLYNTVNQGERARELVSKISFNKLFNKGKKIRQLGYNIAYLKII